MSYCGGLVVSYPWEPTHWREDAGAAGSASTEAIKFYDAGNDVYAFAIESLFPDASSTRHHNSGYLGDVVEAILGICWICKQTTGMAVLLALASKYVFALKTMLNLESLDQAHNKAALRRSVAKYSQLSRQREQQASPPVSEPSKVVSLPADWFSEEEHNYLTQLLQNLRTSEPSLVAICDEARSEQVVVVADTCGDATERTSLDSPRVQHQPEVASSNATGSFIFAMADVSKYSKMQGGSTKKAHEKLTQLREQHAHLLTAGVVDEIDISSEDWWKVWLAKATFSKDIDEKEVVRQKIIGDGVLKVVFEILPYPDTNTKQARTDITVISSQYRVRLHPQSSNKETLPVYVEHYQKFLPRGAIQQATRPRDCHYGLSQCDLMGDKEAWQWAAQQTVAKDLTEDQNFLWYRWVCHARWAQELTVVTFGIAFDAPHEIPMLKSAGNGMPFDRTPYFWGRATRGAAVLHFEVRKGKKTAAYPISPQTYKEKYGDLTNKGGRSYYNITNDSTAS